MDVGMKLQALRKERGLTQAQLAERLGVTHQYISDVERGRALPSLRLFMAWANEIGANFLNLLREAGLIAPDTVELEQEIAALLQEAPDLVEFIDLAREYPDILPEVVRFARWVALEREAKVGEGTGEYDAGSTQSKTE